MRDNSTPTCAFSASANPLRREVGVLFSYWRTRMLSQERLKELLHYDPETGIFTWRVDRGPYVKSGNIAGSLKPNGRIIVWVDRRPYAAHRLAWFYMYGEWPKNTIDHIDRNPANNRISNLQDVPHKINCENKGLYASNRSGFNGVVYRERRGKFQAYITHDGKWRGLGCYATAEEASAAHRDARMRLYTNPGDKLP